MAKVNFTATRINAFKCPDARNQGFLWDAEAPGLGLRVTANGAKAYILEAKIRGKSARLVIGNPDTWSIPQAQAEARRLKVMIDKGDDPRKVKAADYAAIQAADDAQRLATTRESMTVGKVWPIYLESNKARWGTRHYQNHINLAALGGEAKKRGKGLTVSGPLASLMPLPLSSLTGDTIANWLDQETAKRPTNAAQSYRILRALINWANDIPEYGNLIPSDAYSARKVLNLVPKNQAKEGDCLQREQLALWFAAVKQISNPVISVYLQGLLLTGARRNELSALLWGDVDFQWNTICIKDKVEGERTIPLTPYLSSLFSALPRVNEWVFSSSKAKSKHIESPSKANKQALGTAELPHVSIHGLRRSFGTLAEWVEMPVGVVAQIMGHKPSAIAEKHYRRRPIDMLRTYHEKIEAWILKEAKIDETITS